MRRRKRNRANSVTVVLVSAALLAGLLFSQAARPATAQEVAPLHPTFPLLDENSENVLDSGLPLSTMATCDGCHDTAFIAEHSFHADVGLATLGEPGSAGTGREWDISPGLFGKWDPLIYRYLSAADDAIIDLTTPEWVALVGARHVGGGPAVFSRDGERLNELAPDSGNPETAIYDGLSTEMAPWDWAESGVAEMNCFLCHTAEPDNAARLAALQGGDFGWAATATLAGSNIVSLADEQWIWNADAFDENGELAADFLPIQGPTNENCGQCHGIVHGDVETPLTAELCAPETWSTVTTGQVFSPQRVSQSGLNIVDKQEVTRSWDIHAERVVNCTDCHYSLNNPVYYQDQADTGPDHLTFDPRRIDIGEYLTRPLHQFAKGHSAQGMLAPELDNTLRTCESCHNADEGHDWLPYAERHTTALACESCHIPHLYAPAQQTVDWTVLQPDGSPASECRGVLAEGDSASTTLVSGFEPVLLPKAQADGTTALAPFNLIASWFWVYGDPARPVPLRALSDAWLDEDGKYPAAILDTFDKDRNGKLEEGELVIDNDEKEILIRSRLEAQGLADPRIKAEVLPYGISHNVTHGEWATRECATCHGEDSRLTQPMLLAGETPGGVMPALSSSGTVHLQGELVRTDSGALFYEPATSTSASESVSSGLYILGHDSVYWIDWLGILLFMGTLLVVTVHGGLRYLASRRRLATSEKELKEVYMYSMYERLWHWLQTLVIFGLLFTGLIIHKPDKFGIFSFSYVVQVHNILALILVVNAALAAFYHLASGEIQQYLPRPRGFFDQAFAQAKYYLQGIFRDAPHPTEKTPQRKLNPLQQITYFGLLNLLLPLQIITGMLMWGLQRWPELAAMAGGLPSLAPFHTLISWLLASFIVLHVYLTTTGHSATASIRAMMMGWDEVEVHSSQSSEASQTP